MATRTGRRSVAVLRAAGFAIALLFAGLLPSSDGRAASSEDPDWPCIQRKVPEISAGMMWAGPSIEGQEAAWKEDAQVRDLVNRIVVRRTPIEEAEELIEAFAESLGTARNQRLTQVFAGALERINRERGQIIDGIKRYAKRQQGLARQIETRAAEIGALARDDSEDARKARRALEEQQIWDTRIFDEREQSLGYVCESPILLEQRLFALARAIMNQLE